MKKILALLFVLLAAPAGAQVIPSGPVGSLNYWGVGGLSQVLNPGLAGQCLTTQGPGSAPVWVNCQVSSLSLLPPINTNQFYGNVSGNFAPPVGVDVNTILNTVGYDIARPPPVESIIYKSNVGPLFNWQALFPGTAGSLLTSGGPTNPPFWAPSPAQGNLAAICQTVGALLYFNTPSNLWACLNPGTAGQVLQTGGAGANPSWLTLSATAPLTYSSGGFSIAINGITNSLLAQMPADTVKCNPTGSTANAQDCTLVGVPITAFGAVADGVTDAGPAINACLNARTDCVVPPSTNGFFINTTVVVNNNLKGTAFNALNNSGSSFAYPGASWLKCANGIAVCVQLSTNGSLTDSPYLSKLVIAGQGTPTSGSTGLQVAGGYNVNLRDVFVVDFDTCAKLGPNAAFAGLSFQSFNLSMGACQKHFLVDDGWPEARFFAGRWGLNGTGDFSATDDYVFQTLTTAVGAGGGPNGLMLEGIQMNVGSGGGIGCGFRWGGFTGSGGLQLETRISNSHLEFHSYSGAATQGLFCSDSTVPLIQQLYVSHLESSTGSAGTVPVFNFNSATALKQVYFSDNTLGCNSSNISLAPTPSSGAAFSDVHFSNNTGCSSASFTSNGVGSNSLFTNGNTWGSNLTIAGSWQNLNMSGDFYSGTLTDTATGHVSFANSFRTISWTPTLNLGGATTGITYTTQAGTVARTPTGGFYATFSIVLSSKGTATGAATITGLPYTCGSASYAVPVSSGSGNFTGLTGAPTLLMTASAGSTINVVQSSATGQSQLTDTSFTGTTTINGVVTCGSAS